MALLLPIGAAAQVSHFQGSWLGLRSDSTAQRRVQVRGLQVRVYQDCPQNHERECTYEASAVAYRPWGVAASDSTVAALVVRYDGTSWNQVLILRSTNGGQLEALVYTRFTAARGRHRSTSERQLLFRPVARIEHRGPPMPQFPWPPPIPTATLRLPDSLVAIPGRDSLGAVLARLRTALTRVADVDWQPSIYAIDTTGFAVVTRMEAIDADGRPKPGAERWNTPRDRLPSRISGLVDYLRALFFARPGFYRVVVFAVTDLPSQPSSDTLDARRAEALVRGGTDDLPASLKRFPLGPDGRCLALIYEFEKPSEGDSARLVTSTPVGAWQHLALAGLWTDQELRR